VEPGKVKNCRKILIVLDESNDVLKRGIRLAQDEKARVTVLKVVPPYEGDPHLAGIKNLNEALNDASPMFADIYKIARSEAVLVKTRVLSGRVPDRIIEVAEEEKCDLIMIGASKKKRGILSRIFGDHSLEKVLDRATCPVYVVGLSCEG
jgi:nucleotide-binding universal stress UspA family protein